jgi:cytochrome b
VDKENHAMASGLTRTGMLLPMPIWDSPTRLFHWTLVVAVVAGYLSMKLNLMTVHMVCGETVLALLLFRVVWGVIGSDTARFGHFLHSPRAALRHLIDFRHAEPDTQVGHNAAGGWMVLAMLVVLLIQVATGLFVNDVDSFIAGPLAPRISEDAGLQALHWHRFNFNLIKIVVIAHVLAIVAYAMVKKHDLVRPMVTGKKRLPAATPAPGMASPVLAAIVFAVCAVLVWVLVTRG